MAKSEQIRIEIDADASKASSELDGIADDAEALERLTPEIAVTADTDQADRAIRDVTDDAQALSRQDAEIVLRAKIDDAKAALKTLRSDLDQTGDKAEDTARRMDRIGGDGGLKTRGNAIADLTGPLGEASGAASDFAGVFDGIGDIAEDVAGKVGIEAAGMASAIGGIGIAVAGAAALWSYFSERQRKAAEKQKELIDGQRKLNDLIAAGNTRDAASELITQYDAAFKAADRLGLKVGDVTRFITGQADAVPGLDAKLKELQDRYDTMPGGPDKVKLQATIVQFQDLRDSVLDAQGAYDDNNGSLQTQERRLDDVAAALGGVASGSDQAARAAERHRRQVDATKGAMDRLRGSLSMEGALLSFQSAMKTAFDNIQSGAGTSADDILAIKQSIMDVAEYANLTPIQIETLLNQVDNGQLVQVKSAVEGYYAANKVPISTQLRDPSSFDIAEYRRRLTAAIGEVPITLRAAQIRSGAQFVD